MQIFTGPRSRPACPLVLALALLLALSTPAFGQEEPGAQASHYPIRDKVPAPPPPPAWPGVAYTAVETPGSAPTAPTLRMQPQASAAALTPAPVEGRCPPTPDCGLRRDACCWPLDTCGTRYGRFTIRVEGTLTGLSAPSGAFGNIESGLPTHIQWDDLDYGDDLLASVRGRMAVGYAFAPNRRVEARAGWYGSWTSTEAVAGTFAFFPGPAGMGGVSVPNTAVLESSADLYTGELTLWSEIACTGPWRFEWGIGAGAVRFDETATARDWGAPFPGFLAPAFVSSEVENTLLAGQLGWLTHYAVSERLEVSLMLLGRVGSMQSDANVSDRAFFGPGPHDDQDSASSLAFGGVLELGTRLRVTSRLALTLGYNLMLTDGVVRAHRAMDFTQSTSGAVGAALRRETLIAHTGFIGFELNL